MSLASYYAHCFRFDTPQIFNTAGMNGTVCAVTARPSTHDISHCCNGQKRVLGNCLQLCETEDGDGFGECVNSGANTTLGMYKTTCRNVSEVQMVGNASADGDTRKESGAGEFSEVLLGWFLDLNC
jgi:hypothetical protein